VVVVMVMPPVVAMRENACGSSHRQGHNKDFLRVHDLPHLSVYRGHHRPT
jgi:hypothetical protein